MKALLDTCVLSALARPQADAAVRQAVQDLGEDNAFVSVISLGEIAKGIALLAEGARKRSLDAWLRGLSAGYRERVLEIDAATAQLWGELTAAAQQRGRRVAAADGLIAASALRHGLHVMTRNVGDFAPTGVRLVNPWS